MAEKIYTKGIFFNKKYEKAPSFVLGSLSVKPQDFIEWLKAQTPNDKGYVRMQILDGKEKPYITLDTYGMEKKEPAAEDLPF